MSELEQKKLMSMGLFACRMHLIINCAPAASKGLKAFEGAACVSGENPYSLRDSESGAERLARTAASAFTARGSQTAGVPVMWKAFLQGKKMKNLLLTFHGHRMNIMFYDCAAVYCHKSEIQEFISQWCDHNQLLKSVQFDSMEKLYLAGCRWGYTLPVSISLA
jgi:hypothetical protein